MTTLGLGGAASHYARCISIADVREALRYAAAQQLEVFVLGGGSNLIVQDRGFKGLVIHLQVKGIKHEAPRTCEVAAGEVWDDFVVYTIEQGWAGIEGLSGIPGLVGATPIQNVGAYGQEVAQVIESVLVLDRQDLSVKEIQNKDCHFSYRNSRFKTQDQNRYIVTSVRFNFSQIGIEIKYRELENKILKEHEQFSEFNTAKKLQIIRQSVLELRRGKAMVIDSNEPNSRSAGSFFTNPIVDQGLFSVFEDKCQKLNKKPVAYPANEKIKISAAWLVENSGFFKGFTHKGVRVSEKHCLALVNVAGNTTQLLELSKKIQNKVHETFGVRLEQEPIILGCGEVE